MGIGRLRSGDWAVGFFVGVRGECMTSRDEISGRELRPLRVLFVEDSEDDVLLLVHELKCAGYAVGFERVETEEAMLSALAGGEWDIVLSDYDLPRFSGPAALALVREKGYRIPFVIVTGAVGEEQAVEMMKAGASDYVMKENLVRLGPAVRHALDAVAQEQRAQRYLDLAGVIFVALDRRGGISLINRKGCELLGHAEAELVGRNWFDVCLPERMRREVKAVFDRLVAGTIEPVEYYENPVVTRSGRERMIAWHNTILRDESGAITGTLSSGEDVTERRRAEDALRESEEFSTRVLSVSSNPILVISSDTTIRYVNPAFEMLTGYTAESLVGQRPPYPWWTNRPPVVELPDLDAIDLRQGHTYEEQFRSKNGRDFTVEATFLPVRDGAEYKYYVTTWVDITARKRVAAALEFRAGFERIVSTLAAEVVAASRTELDAAIERGLGAIGSFAGVDRSYILLFQEDGLLLDNTHEWCAAGIAAQRAELHNLPFDSMVPWLASQIRRLEPVYIPDMAALPRAAEAERRYFCDLGIHSLVCVPMVAAGRLIGILGFDSVRRAKVWTEDVISLLRVAADVFTGAIERRSAVSALAASEAKLRSIFRAAPTGVGLVVNRVLQEVNEQFCEMLGYAREELIGRDARFVYPTQADYAYVGKEKYRQIKEQGTGSVETRFRRKDGGILDVLLSSTPLDPDDLSAGVTFTALDITDRKSGERALRESEARFRSILVASPDAITVTDAQGNVTVCNDAALRLMGYESRGELVGKPSLQMVAPEDRERAEQDLRRVLEEGMVRDLRHTTLRLDGTRVEVETSATVLQDVSGKPVSIVAATRDVTERERLQHEIAESSRRERERFQRDLHDSVCQQLAGIGLMLGRLRRRLKDSASAEAEAVEEIGGLVYAVDEQAQQIAKGLQPVSEDPNSLATALEDLAARTSAATELSCRFYRRGAVAVADRDAASQLFLIAQEAVHNAVRHAAAGRIGISLSGKDNRRKLTVRDDGQGLPEPGARGGGMGLRIMAHRATSIGASLEVRGKPGKGTSVVCTWRPAAQVGNRRVGDRVAKRPLAAKRRRGKSEVGS